MNTHKESTGSSAPFTDNLTPELRESYDRLSELQKKFVVAYDGNATRTAELVGYRCPKDAGCRAMRHVEIRKLLDARRQAEIRPGVATRQERQRFWSEIMQDQEIPWKHRLKASELLGKSQGDFIQKLEGVSGPTLISVSLFDDTQRR